MNQEKLIREYNAILGKKCFFPKTILGILPPFFKKDSIVFSDSKIIRGTAKVLKMEKQKKTDAVEKAELFMALKDSMKILERKRVPVYFYNRIGLKKDFQYSNSAVLRIQNELSFPKMISDIDRYENYFKELLGEKYNKEYIDELSKISQIIKRDNIYCHEDQKSKYVNVIDGKRITIPCFAKTNNNITIHIYGRCGVFGYAVSDDETLPSQLQKVLNDNGYVNYRVVNHGLWGGSDENIIHNFLFEMSSFGANDIVLFYMSHLDKRFLGVLQDCGLIYKEITEEWHQYAEAKWCFYDRPGHMNAIGYMHVANIIFKDFVNYEFGRRVMSSDSKEIIDASILNQYLKTHGNIDFEKEVESFTSKVLEKYPLDHATVDYGSIVMNCNPFTKGHKYLIEFASKKVKRLYIFVVEEDKSYFKFEDRFEMVKEGTRDIKNVVVVPSGKMIISTVTFPEYFLKDYVKEKNFDVSNDLHTFAKLICPALRITMRFAGEEPFDPVTKNYNESMSKILPAYGIRFIEIPRLSTTDGSEIINATKVRELILQRDVAGLERYVPITTLNIIKEKYL